MDLNEIEDEYRKVLDLSEKKFLEDIKAGRNINEVELEYKKSTEKARLFYNSELSKFLKTNKYVPNPKLNSSLQVKNSVFKADTSDYGLTFFQRLNINLSVILFKIMFKIKNKFKKNLPNPVLYTYFILKIKLIRLINAIKIPIQFVEDKTSESLYFVKTKFKEITHTKS